MDAGADLEALARANRRLARKLERALANLARVEDLKEATRLHLQSVIADMQQTEDELLRKNEALEATRARLEASERAAQAASAAKSAFLANMSHELRTPLNAIIGYVELVLDDALLARPLSHELSSIRRASLHLLGLISDILDISKIESGRVQLEHRPLDLSELVHVVGTTMTPLAAAKNLDLAVEAPPSLTALGDEVRLRQILTNLVGNAIKFTAAGRVRLTVRHDDARVLFYVEDTGIGMTEDELGRVFLPFVQADDTTTRRFGGTGLGLPISKQLVELQGGTLSMTSQPGRGTRCEVSIPVAWADGTALLGVH